MTGEYSVSDLRRILRATDSELKACLRAALLPVATAKRPYSYSFQQLVVLRTAKGLSDAGVPLRRIRKVLESLQRQLGSSRSISSVKVYASGKRVVVWDGAVRWQPDSGQFLLNFEAELPQTTKHLVRRTSSASQANERAREWFDRGLALQEDSREEACRAYEQAIRLRPSFVEAHINLGLLYHDAGELDKAESCYRRAIRARPDYALAHFNHGVVLEDLQDDLGAMKAYQAALRLDPELKQAHCNLAQLYERHGRRRDALRHYAAAKRLP